MTFKILQFFINFYTLTFILISLASFSLIMFLFSPPLLETFVRSFLFWNVGIRGLLACVANWIPSYADQIAVSYGWEPKQSFQKEIASADGAFGLMGILTPFFSIDFSLATIVGFCFCTFFSELADLIDLHRQKEYDHLKTARSIKWGMCIDLALSLLLLTAAFVWKYRS